MLFQTSSLASSTPLSQASRPPNSFLSFSLSHLQFVYPGSEDRFVDLYYLYKILQKIAPLISISTCIGFYRIRFQSIQKSATSTQDGSSGIFFYICHALKIQTKHKHFIYTKINDIVSCISNISHCDSDILDCKCYVKLSAED